MSTNQKRIRRLSQSLVERRRIASDWQDQKILVYNQSRRLGEVLGGKLYHGTTAELSPGDILEPKEKKNFPQSSGTSVSITSDRDRAIHWAREVAKKSGGEPGVYEIEPLAMVEAWRVQPANYGKNIVLWEGRVKTAKVVQRVV